VAYEVAFNFSKNIPIVECSQMKYKILIILIVVVVLFSLSVNSREGFSGSYTSESEKKRLEEQRRAEWNALSPEEKASRNKTAWDQANESNQKFNNALIIIGIVIGSIVGFPIVGGILYGVIWVPAEVLARAVRKRRAMRNPSNATSDKIPPSGGPEWTRVGRTTNKDGNPAGPWFFVNKSGNSAWEIPNEEGVPTRAIINANRLPEGEPPRRVPTRAIINANRLPEGEPPRRVVGRGASRAAAGARGY
jgi:hypothetical protein